MELSPTSQGLEVSTDIRFRPRRRRLWKIPPSTSLRRGAPCSQQCNGPSRQELFRAPACGSIREKTPRACHLTGRQTKKFRWAAKWILTADGNRNLHNYQASAYLPFITPSLLHTAILYYVRSRNNGRVWCRADGCRTAGGGTNSRVWWHQEMA